MKDSQSQISWGFENKLGLMVWCTKMHLLNRNRSLNHLQPLEIQMLTDSCRTWNRITSCWLNVTDVCRCFQKETWTHNRWWCEGGGSFLHQLVCPSAPFFLCVLKQTFALLRSEKYRRNSIKDLRSKVDQRHTRTCMTEKLDSMVHCQWTKAAKSGSVSNETTEFSVFTAFEHHSSSQHIL